MNTFKKCNLTSHLLLPQYSCWVYSFKRINGLAAFLTVTVNFTAGAFRIVLKLQKDILDPNGFLFKVGDVNFLTFDAWFFLFGIVLSIGVSLLRSIPSMEKVRDLTFQIISAEEKTENKASFYWKDIVISILVIAVVGWIIIIFNEN